MRVESEELPRASSAVPCRRPSILLTEGSSTSARNTLFALGRHYDIDVLDPSPFCQCRFSRFVRRWYRCPSYARQPDAYLEFLVHRLRQTRYDVLFPTHEQVYLLARVRDELSALVGLAVPDFTAVDRVQSKASFARLLTELDLPGPATAVVRPGEELFRQAAYPCWVKLAYSTAGQGVRLVQDADAMRQLLQEWEHQRLLEPGDELVIQQPAPGQLACIMTIFQHGRLVGSHSILARVRGVGGAPMAKVGVHHPQVVEEMRRLGRHLQWHGALAVEYFYDEASQRHSYLEANPRIGETWNAASSGVNLCRQLVQIAQGEDVDEQPPASPGMKTHQSFLMLVSRALEGATRRELFRELCRNWRQVGAYDGSEDELTRLADDWLSAIPATAVTALLLLRPRAHRWLVAKTVDNYALPGSAAERIRARSAASFQRCFEQ